MLGNNPKEYCPVISCVLLLYRFPLRNSLIIGVGDEMT